MYRLIALTLLVMTFPQLVFASSVLRSGDSVGVAANQAVEGDFYGFGNNIAISGEITEDLLALGTSLKINGQVGKDLLVVAGSADIDGVVGEDVRLVAGEVTVSGEIKGDLVVIAGKLVVLSTAVIDGDVLFFGSEAVIGGAVGKSVYGTSENINIDGVVDGDVDISTNYLSLGEHADVTGSIKYASGNELVRSQSSRVAGKVVKNSPISQEVKSTKDLAIPALIFLFASLVWYLLFPSLIQKVSEQSLAHPTRGFVIGLGIILIAPLISVVLTVSTLGSLIGFSIVFMYLAVLTMSLPVAAGVLGVYISHYTKHGKNISLVKVIIGSLALFTISFVPLFGPVLFVFLCSLTLGSLSTLLYRSVRSI